MWNGTCGMVNPLTIGHPKKRGSQQQDGFISSLQAILFLVSLVASMSFAHLISKDSWSHRVTRSCIQVTLVVYMVGAMVFMILLWSRFCNNCVFRKKEPVPMATNCYERTLNCMMLKAIRKILREVDELPVLGIVAFYFGGTPLDIVLIAAHIDCAYVYHACGYTWRFAGYVIFYAVRLVFMATTMMFCITFYDRVLRRCVLVRYSLIVIITASLGVWLDITLSETFPSFDNLPQHNTTCFFPGNVIDHKVEICLQGETALYDLAESLSVYMYPLNIEYMLLATEVLFHLYLGAVGQERFDELKEGSDQPGQLEDGAALGEQNHTEALGNPALLVTEAATWRDDRDQDTTNELHPTQDYSEQDDPSTLRSIQVVDDLVSVSLISHQELSGSGILANLQHSPDDIHCPCLLQRILWFISHRWFCIVVSLVLNVAFIFNRFYIFKTFQHWFGWMLYTVHNVLDLVTCIAGFIVAHTFTSEHKDYSGPEIVLILSMTGQLMYFMLMMIAVVALLLDEVSHFPHLQLQFLGMYMLLLGIVLYLQTSLLLHAARVNLSTVQPRHSPAQSQSLLAGQPTETLDRRAGPQFLHRHHQNIFLNVMLYLSIFNFAMWFTDSFSFMLTEKHSIWFPVADYYFTEHSWEAVMHILKPLILFYHFNCFMMFMQIFLKNKACLGKPLHTNLDKED